ncbi:MAG: chromosomal replication initiator protein DnaA [bacterium]|nr:chromosomal replication initiator protein DnaA [bacterium]
MTIEECQKLYDRVIGDLKKTIEEESFLELSIENKKISKFLNGYIYVVAEDDFSLSKINKFYIKRINSFIPKYTDETILFKFVSKDEMSSLMNTEEVSPTSLEKNLDDKYRPGNIDATYTFTNFVVGKSNKFAYTFAMQTAENPGKNFNPLYIFGGVGIGKTHLMQAIGNYILDKDIHKKVLYVEAKEFCDDYIHACNSQIEKQRKIDEFHQRYRDIDILLVDDIQILCGKDKTQEEFFTLFNFLINRNKQIVITCDRPANALEGMADRLKSRFDQGLVVDITPPDLDLRTDILKKKIKTFSSKNDLPDDVLEFIASSFTSNIRELEGALNRVMYYSVFNDSPITLDLAKEALATLIKSQKNANKYANNSQVYENIQSVVAAYYNISVNDLISSKRSAKITLPRHIAMFLIKDLYDLPYKKIGSLFGGRDHTTVMSAVEKIENDLKSDEELKMAVDNIKKKLNI